MAIFSGQTAVVTGAGRGLGRAIAAALGGEGASVWVCARTASELERTAERIRARGGRVRSRALDLGDPEACRSFIGRALEESGAVDVLVNNAAVLRFTPVERLSLSEWSETLAVNLTAPFLLAQGFLAGMKERGGSIINVSSRAGVLGFAEEAAYCASKFALEGFTRALALELEGTNVSVNTVTPGLRIKPTSLSEQEAESAAGREEWKDPSSLDPAFIFLARLRGELSGLRFNAYRLAQALVEEGRDLSVHRIRGLAEAIP